MSFGFSISNKVDYTGSVDFVKLWAEASALLRDVIPDNVYYSWLTAVAANSFEHGKFYLVTPHQFAVAILNSHKKDIKEALCKVCGKDVDFELNYDAGYGQKYNEMKKKEAAKQRPSLEDPVKKEQALAEGAVQMRNEVNLNLKYKFENFVVGENSRMAYAVAMAVAEKPAQKYNPLFIYGASGLGKTHLMQAIGHYILFHKPKLRVKYVKTEEYINEVISSIQKGGDRVSRMDKFRQKFRNVDVLLIDDIQFISGKDKTQEAFFNTFNALHQANKQIILSSDRPPGVIPTLTDRLRSRFQMGMTIDVNLPDYETRVAIIEAKAKLNDSIDLPRDTAEYIAKTVRTNIRELEGALNQVMAYAEMRNITPTVEFASEILANSRPSQTKHITARQIVEKTCKYFEIKSTEIKSQSRHKTIVVPRQIAMYLLRSELHMSYPDIAHELGRSDHTTAMHSISKIERQIKLDITIREKVEAIKELLYV